ncbi:MAG TPA: glycosyltransferase [Vicinamibacterales bacterium]|nr:glycosyltransferase [Vicinamibacterales bacterium]
MLSLSPGGTERLVIEIVRALSNRIDSIVCCLDEPGAWASELAALNVPVISLGRTPGFQPRLAMRLARILKHHRVDVVHCHHYSPYVYGLLASILKPNVKLVFTEHGKLSDAGPSSKRKLVNPILSWWPGRLCAVSADLKDHMVAEGFPARRLNVVYNGIDPGKRPTAIDRHAARVQLRIPEDAFLVGTVGRLDPVKNLQLLLKAHAIVRNKVSHAHTVIVGDGPERPALEAKAAELGIADSVTFAGYRQDVRFLMAAFDIYVNCSNYEGVSLTILEAMASALPVVATPVGGNPEVVLKNETGLLITGGESSLADAILTLALDPRRRRVMGDTGRWRVKRHFSIERMVEQYASAYLGGRAIKTETAVPPAIEPMKAEAISVRDATRSIV